MPMNQARVLFCAVQRKQRFQATHPDVKIELVYAPVWHWTAEWTDPDGAVRLVANHDLSLLMDVLTDALDG